MAAAEACNWPSHAAHRMRRDRFLLADFCGLL